MSKYLNDLARELHATSKANGFWDGEVTYSKIMEKVLYASVEEGGELIQAIKKDEGPKAVTDEIADIFIRYLDLFEVLVELGIAEPGLDEAIILKDTKNKSRGRMHGKKTG